MGPLILIALIILILFIAFRYFKPSIGNSQLRDENDIYLPGDTDDGAEPEDDPGDDAGGSDDSENGS